MGSAADGNDAREAVAADAGNADEERGYGGGSENRRGTVGGGNIGAGSDGGFETSRGVG